jgi:hypothetical protein
MSVQAISWVLDHSQTTGATRLVMIGIANHVDARGEGWAYVSEVLRTANVSENSYHRAVAEAKAMGELQVDTRAGGSLKTRGDRRPNMFRFPPLTEAYEGTQVRPPQDGDPVDSRPPQADSHDPPRMGTTDSRPVNDPSLFGAEQARPTKRAHQLPDSWQPTEQHYRMATERGLSVEGEAEQFEDYHRAKGSTMKDWDRAFNTWLRNASKFAGRGLRAVDDPRYSDDPAIRAQAYGTTITDRSRPAWMDAKDA